MAANCRGRYAHSCSNHFRSDLQPGDSGREAGRHFLDDDSAGESPISIGIPHSCADAYPTAAIQVHAEGTTTLAFTITTNGTVKDIKVEKSSGNKDLDDASVGCASHWLYKPATKDSKAVETLWEANVDWKLGVPPGVRIARQCLRYREDASPIPPNIGPTSITFRIMPDGTIKDVNVVRPSGDASLDNAAVLCASSNRYDTSIMALPPEGVPGHADVEWETALTNPGFPVPDFIRPKPISSHMCDVHFATAKKVTVSGPTILSFKIIADGSVQNVRVSKSSGNEVFDQEGALCAEKWRYEPATENGKPVASNWSAMVDWQRH